MAKYASEMRLFDPDSGHRLYMDAREREQFLIMSNELLNLKHRIFCQALHWSGARVSELLALTGEKIDFQKSCITLRTIKKRKFTKKGELKAPSYRQIPVPSYFLDSLDLVFELRARKRRKEESLKFPLWASENDPLKSMSRVTAWRAVKKVLGSVKPEPITGPQASPKGFRHGFSVAMVIGGMDVHTLQRLLGHESASTTAIYLQILGQEALDQQLTYWQEANKSWNKL